MEDTDKVIIVVKASLDKNVSTEEFQEEEFVINYKAACLSELWKDHLKDEDKSTEVPTLPVYEDKECGTNKVSIRKVIEFINKHENDPMKEIEKPIKTNDINQIVGEWDAKFIDIDIDIVYDVVTAANFLRIESLVDLALAKIASTMYGKEPSEVKKSLNINEEITPEEEEKTREDNPWVLEMSNN